MPAKYPGSGRPPIRRLKTLFLGAGASKAAGIPLTEELLENVWPRRGSSRWNQVRSEDSWNASLLQAVRVLYPDGDLVGYRPNVADFFTVLEVVAAVHDGRARLPVRASELLAELRTEIALGLLGTLKTMSVSETPQYGWLTSPNRPKIIITSNWDNLVEAAGVAAGLRVLLSWPVDSSGRPKNDIRKDEIVVLKLHGSVDWGFNRDIPAKPKPLNSLYSDLSTAIGAETPFGKARKSDLLPLRYRSLDVEAESTLGFSEPLMATMAVGKQVQVDALEEIWNNAYWVLSRAASLDVVGYSFPTDDLELRTLLRTTTRQAGGASLAKDLRLSIVNPSPSAHERGRKFLGSTVKSDYRGGSDWAVGSQT